MNFNEKLQKLRKERNITQESLAEKLNVSRQAVSKWEAGQTMPEIEKIIEIAKIYTISLDDLLLNQEEFEPKSQADVFQHKKKSARMIIGCIFLGIGAIVLLILYITYICNVTNLKDKVSHFYEFIEYFHAAPLVFCCVLSICIGSFLFIDITKLFKAYCRQTFVFKLGTGIFLLGIICLTISMVLGINFAIPVHEAASTFNFIFTILVMISFTIATVGIILVIIGLIQKKRLKKKA